ncbi:MAG TPA: TadE/TadG family type IV pilus assembly protein [Burkholderiaceae bacterium]|nr:TadE/TadG family type IV pilus assembly protein [Burkholderiaceae bacterium]
MRQSHRRRPASQRGVAAIEFALIASILFTLLLGVMEMGRLLWTWNAAVEATRYGARLAVVCDLNDSHIKTRMISRLPTLQNTNITISYLNPPAAVNTCTAATCKAVKVSLTGYTHTTVIPFVPLTLTLPPFGTTLRKEFMSSASNQVCQ